LTCDAKISKSEMKSRLCELNSRKKSCYSSTRLALESAQSNLESEVMPRSAMVA
jgi:hypothetical protein